MYRRRQGTHWVQRPAKGVIGECRAGVRAAESAQLGKRSTRQDGKVGCDSTEHRLKTDDS